MTQLITFTAIYLIITIIVACFIYNINTKLNDINIRIANINENIKYIKDINAKLNDIINKRFNSIIKYCKLTEYNTAKIGSLLRFYTTKMKYSSNKNNPVKKPEIPLLSDVCKILSKTKSNIYVF